MKKSYLSLIEIHLAVLLFGLSGLFAKWLDLPPIVIAFGRVLFSSIFLFIVLWWMKKPLKLNTPKHYRQFAWMGLVLALHWTSFFLAIQRSTVAIGLLSFCTFPVFVTFMEPIFFKEKIKPADIIAALAAFIGLGVVVLGPTYMAEQAATESIRAIGTTSIFDFSRLHLSTLDLSTLDLSTLQGVLWGALSGFTYALLAVYNRKFVQDTTYAYSGLQVAFYEQLFAGLFLLPLIFVSYKSVQVRPGDLGLLILLGTIFTGLSHALFINGLKQVRAQTAGLISNLEPFYGIFFAALLLGEVPPFHVYLGGALLLGTAIGASQRSIKSE